MKAFLTISVFLFLGTAVSCSSVDEKARTLYNQALAAQREGRSDEARQLLEQVTRDFPQTETATQANGLLMLQGGVGTLAIEDNEKAAVAWLRTINTGAVTYLSMENGAFPRTLRDLVSKDLLDANFIDGENAGYRFNLIGDGNNYTATAEPIVSGVTGRHFFYTDSENFAVLSEDGKPAGPDSLRVEE